MEGKKTHSPRFAKEVTRITKETSNKTASKILGISDSKVYRIDKEELEKQIVDYRDKIPSFESVGVDEISIKKRHNYMTVLYNLDDSKVIWLEPNRKKEDLQKIFSYLGNKINRIKYITLDFWKAYEKAIKSDLPKAKLIYDKFHLTGVYLCFFDFASIS